MSQEVVIIGGGATGIGILRDLSMRGIPAVLLEQGGLAYGTSSRFHGLLHSGARYAVNDAESARECIEENMILRKIGRQCVEATEGFFTLTDEDDPAHVSKWTDACANAGIKTEEISVDEALHLEPNLSKSIKRVFRVPDSCIDGFRLVWQNASSARKYGGELYTYYKVTGIDTDGGKVKGVTALDTVHNKIIHFPCSFVVNASGSWSAEIAKMVGLDVPISPDRGSLIVFNHRFTSRVINRLHKSSDGDIFVPHGSVTILGTTSAEAESPNDKTPTSEDVRRLIEIGRTTFPAIDDYRILRAFAGTRPLFGTKGSGRGAARTFSIVDHSSEGIEGFVSIFGGKLTTYRLMAEKISDIVAGKLGVTQKCRTAEECIVPDVSPKTIDNAKKYFPPHAVALVADRVGADFQKIIDDIEKSGAKKNEFVCECEMVTLAEIKHIAADPATHYLNDIRLRTRLGMGTCQGTFCSQRAIAALEKECGNMSLKPADNIRAFLQERWNGLRPVLWGSQLEETELSRAIYLSTLNFDGGFDEA